MSDLRAYLAKNVDAEAERRARWFYRKLYPDSGELRRELYGKHVEIFKAGALHRERLACMPNQVGKSTLGAYETMVHLTGLYPDWWEGKRFSKPILAWAAGKTNKDTRDIVQKKLFGEWGEFGKGIIPFDHIVRWTTKQGIPEAVDTAYVKHVKGGNSQLVLKSYEQGWESFVGGVVEFIWADEEPPELVYNELPVRTINTDGRVLLTFTPLLGLSVVVKRFFEEAVNKNELAFQV